MPDFFEGTAEALSGGKCTEAQHRVIPLFNPTMILLNAAVQISIAAMLGLGTKRFPDRTRVGIVPVGGDLSRSLVDNRESAAEESLGSVHVASGTQQRVDQIAFPIRGAVEIAPLALDLYVGFIDIPTPANLALACTP